MNTPNPLVPHGFQLEQKSNARSRVKLAVFFVLTVHVVGLMALLVQGCRPEEQEVAEQPAPPPEVPIFEPIPIPPAETNKVLLPPVEELPPAQTALEPTYTQPTSATPVTTPPLEPSSLPGTPMVQEYVIRKGDTYYSIGRQFGVAMQAIKEANPGVEPTRLQVGQKINIPPPLPAAQETVAPTGSKELVYTVVSGDTLSGIARKHRTTWQAIKELNNLPTTSIKVGQKLRIPASTTEGAGSTGTEF